MFNKIKHAIEFIVNHLSLAELLVLGGVPVGVQPGEPCVACLLVAPLGEKRGGHVARHIENWPASTKELTYSIQIRVSASKYTVYCSTNSLTQVIHCVRGS